MQNNILEYPFVNGLQIAQSKTRIIAFIVDILIYATIGTVFGYFFGMPIHKISSIGFEFNGTSTCIWLLLGFFLWPISEGLWGQTIGKRILNIKVLTDHYESIDITASITRYILGFIDYLFLIGFIVIANNTKNKRIGDIAANTIVVQM